MDNNTDLLVPADYGALRTDDLLRLLKVSRSTFLKMVQRGDFPPGTSLTDDGRNVIWSPAEVNAWWRARMQARAVSLERRREMTAAGTAASIAKARASHHE